MDTEVQVDATYNGTDTVQYNMARHFLKNGYRLCKYRFTVLVPTGTPTSFKLPALEVLKDKFIRYLQVFSVEYVAASPGPSGNATNIPAADFDNGFITLKNNSNMELHYSVPLICLDAQQVNLQPLYYVGDIKLSWDNCQLDFAAALTAEAGNGIPFLVHYWNKC